MRDILIFVRLLGLSDQVQVALSQEAGPETVLRAATHGLILGALQEDGPLPGELAALRPQVQAGKTACARAHLRRGGKGALSVLPRM